MKKQSVGVGLLGLGTVGGQVARVLTEKAASLSEQVGCPLVLRKIKCLPQDLERPLAKELPAGILTTDDAEFFSTPGVDIIAELIGGEHPAYEYQKRALGSDRHVVTANKEVIAKHGVELLGLSQQHDVGLCYEGSVGGGIPLIAPFKHDLVANDISGVYAIINGTTNYILTRMAKEGADFASALKVAQQLGYAEANPKNDIEGIDAVYKLAILATLAFQMEVKPDDIYCEGISRISSRDFRYAREFGFAIKLLAIGKQSDGSIEVRVHPVLIPEDTFLAKVDGVYNAVLVEGDLVGKVLFFGEGAGARPTSSAVVADIVYSAQKIFRGIGGKTRLKIDSGRTIKPMSAVETEYYLRITAADRPGVLAQIARTFGDHLISISSAIQREAESAGESAEIVIMTHPAREQAMQQALAELARLPVVKEISNFIRVENV
ncbi:MAG: homoserine dehydrogenase [Dehalococcoidales bacterium]|nr:homoserine dehydrogenase [Dehalococcoidales bacterium]